MAHERTRFTLSEEIWNLCEQRHEPATIQIEARVAGSIEEGRLCASVAAAVATHPMMRARKVSERRFVVPAQWEILSARDIDVHDVVSSVYCETESELAARRTAFFGEWIDVRRAPTPRLLLAQTPHGDSVLLSVHHAVCDGIGALRFLQSVARAYVGRPDPIPAVDPLGVRDLKFCVPATSSQSRNSKLRRTPTDRPMTIALEGASGEPGYGFSHVVLSAAESGRLDPRRWVPSATINDLLLAALHNAIADWNTSRGRPHGCISVAMPINLRPSEWRDEVVGNLAIAGNVLSTAEQRVSPDLLLAAVTDQTRHLKAGGATRLLSLPGWVQCVLPLLLPVLLGRVRQVAAVLSNLGRLAQVPSFGPEAGEITQFWFSGPIGMPTGLSVGAASLDGRLHLSLRYRRALFSDAAARRFTDIFLSHLVRYGEQA